jgi:hypothetical protein
LNPVFPQTFEIEGPVGTYKLNCFLDVGANNPTAPGAEDHRCAAVDVTLKEGEVVNVDLVLAP